MGSPLAGRIDLAPSPRVNPPLRVDLTNEEVARAVLALQRAAHAVRPSSSDPTASRPSPGCSSPSWSSADLRGRDRPGTRQAGGSTRPCRSPDPWSSTSVSRRPPAPTCRSPTTAYPDSDRPSAVRPVSSPSSSAGPTRVTMRALHWDLPSLSSQQSTVAPGRLTPPNVTSRRAKRRCRLVTPPTVPVPAALPVPAAFGVPSRSIGPSRWDARPTARGTDQRCPSGPTKRSSART